METLLRSNRRAGLVLVALAALLGIFGLILVVVALAYEVAWLLVLAVPLAAYGCCEFARQLLWWWRPRLALDQGDLVVFLRQPQPYRVPLDVVECFFIGQAPSSLGERLPSGARIENVTVVVRLAERATQWSQRPTNRAVGRWCDGYITILGDWSDRIDGDVVTQLNRRLVDYKRQWRQRAPKAMENAG